MLEFGSNPDHTALGFWFGLGWVTVIRGPRHAPQFWVSFTEILFHNNNFLGPAVLAEMRYTECHISLKLTLISMKKE